MNARRVFLVVVTSFCVLSGGLSFCGASAFALDDRALVGSFHAPSRVTGVAVDQETGNVYGAESEAGVLAAFGPEGGAPSGVPATTSAFTHTAEPIGVAIDNACWYHQPRLTGAECEAFDPSNGDLYVADPGGNAIEKLALNKLSGEYEKVGALPFKEPNGVAVDHEGNVYVADYFEPAIPVFSPSGTEIGKIQGLGSPLVGHPAFIAVGTPGEVYVSDYSGGTAQLVVNSKYEVQSETLVEASGKAVALDASGNVLVDAGSSVSEYSPSLGLIGSFGQEEPGSLATSKSFGLAVNATTGKAYVSTESKSVNVYGSSGRPLGPTIHAESAERVLFTSAKLRALIDPNDVSTTYHFEYDISAYNTSAPHATSIPGPDADIGAGSSDVPVSVQAEDLLPGTIYHYRVVAVSEFAPGENGTFDGPDRTFTTFAHPSACPANEQLRTEQPYALGLPDCRAYEMVSPLDKSDNNVVEGEVRASVSGEAVTYASKGSFAKPMASMYSDRYMARRDSTGWATQNISPPFDANTNSLDVPYGELWFTPDLSKGLVIGQSTPLTDESPVGYVNLYVADIGSGSYQAVTGPPPGLPPHEQDEYVTTEPKPVGVSTDLSHVVFEEYAHQGLTPDASPNHFHVYEWAGGHLSLVDVAPQGMTLEAEDQAGASELFIGPAEGDVWHAVSSDGSRVFFTGGEVEGPGGGMDQLGQVYAREVDLERTLQVSASQRTVADPNGITPARYWGASTDGSKVFFTSRSELTDDANTGPADNAANLYEYDLDTGVLTDLTVDSNAGDTNGAAVLGLVTAGEDGSYVYFVAEGKLAEGGTSGRPNLYLDRAGKTVFIATLAPGSGPEERGGDRNDWHGGERGEWGPAQHSVRVSPDGRTLAFESELSLTGYDNEPTEPQECASGRCREVYLYDAANGTLACASCDQSGAPPSGPAGLGGNDETRQGLGVVHRYYEPRNLSEDASRLFFHSPDSLVAQDRNGRQDVYEYENGRVYPVSDVAGNFDSYFLDATPSGNDVFIATADHLLPSDTDSRIDVYDARVGGGLPVSEVPPVCVNGDSCKGPVSPQPGVFGAPASATFSGAENVRPVVINGAAKAKAKPKRCKRGSVRKRGRCVRRRSARHGAHSKAGRK